MEKKFYGIAVGLGLGILTSFISGCATSRIDLVDEGVVSVENTPSRKARILWTNVYQDGDDLVVYGVVQRRNLSSYPIKIHVDISVSSPDGKVLHKARTSDVYVPRRIPGRGRNFKRFRIRFPDIPPKGSLVRAICHSGPHNGTT